jgi:Protein of unknown function (DUF4079)
MPEHPILNLPSFLWLWKLAAWSMGLSLLAYCILGVSGIGMQQQRVANQPRPQGLRQFHSIVGAVMVLLVLLLLAIGLVGTIGHYGNLGHSPHVVAGFSVVGLVLLSGWSATQIGAKSWARSLHVGTNIILFVGFLFVSLTGWIVVQKYLP